MRGEGRKRGRKGKADREGKERRSTRGHRSSTNDLLEGYRSTEKPHRSQEEKVEEGGGRRTGWGKGGGGEMGIRKSKIEKRRGRSIRQEEKGGK